LALAIILLLGAGLRLWRIGANSLWFDEAFSWLVAQQPAWAILTQRLEPILPPLYHLALHFWIPLGESEATLRSFSALCGLLTLPAMYALGRQLFSRRAGLAAALLTAVLPFHVYFAQEARLYALVVLLAALLLWAFFWAWQSNARWRWATFGLLAALGLYAHYFTAFSLLILHGYALLQRPCQGRRWRGLLLADLLALALIAPQLPAALAQTQRVTGRFWLAPPSPLQPLKTLDYLLFSHTTPLPLMPVALFLVLSILAIVTLVALRADAATRRALLLLLALTLLPLLIAWLLSWTVGPIYLDRAFSLVTPAYVLLLAWGLAHPPHRSPLPLLYAGLAVVALISLGNHYRHPDPAKPPFRELSVFLKKNWQEGDVLLHLHDSTYLPLRYYAPQLNSYLLNNDPETWLPPYTWDWAGQRVEALDEAATSPSRLWLLIAPARLDERQTAFRAHVQAGYQLVEQRTWPAYEALRLELYRPQKAAAP